jgi:hypothetical protein
MHAHAESLDSKAGVVLGFAGVLVGLGATAQSAVSDEVAFQVGLGFAVFAALFAAVSFLPRRYPVLEVARLRENNLTAGGRDQTRTSRHGDLDGRPSGRPGEAERARRSGVCSGTGCRSGSRGGGYTGRYRRPRSCLKSQQARSPRRTALHRRVGPPRLRSDRTRN